MIYYYVLSSSIYKIESTESIDQLILLLYNGTADFVSDVQRKELKLPPDYIDQLKKKISSSTHRVPLYDIRFNHIYLIHADNVYSRIFRENYRLIDKNFYTDLIELTDPSESDIANRRILSYYDLDKLTQTYFKIFYESFVLDSYITSCRRPSFNSQMEHIKPYYDLSELYYMALDWGVIKPAELKKLDPVTIRQICKKISIYDIPAETLLDHQMHISATKSIGLVKNYSLFGSYFINRYLREYGCCLENPKPHNHLVKNSVLENQIRLMINLIATAPAFMKFHTVYRFIESDHFIKHLKVGDVYIDPSFMSTTRNPYVYQENIYFGYILLKIRIPGNIIGVGLCIESYSNFPSEEEIVLPPTSAYELISITEEPDIQHHIADKKLSLNKTKKKYEFILKTNSFVGKKMSGSHQIKLNMLPISSEPAIQTINLEQLLKTDESIKLTSITDRLKHFTNSYINQNSQFKSIINKLDITFILQSYNSTGVYSEFFYYQTPTGLLLYSFNPTYGNINIMLELGPEIHLNYYFRYSVTDTSAQLDLNNPEWIKWLSLLAYVIGSRTVVIHSNYVASPRAAVLANRLQIHTRYTHSDDVYIYLNQKKKLFTNFTDEITPNFDYAQLDYLRSVSVFDILEETDRNELYKLATESNLKSVADFYVYIVDNFPNLLKTLEEKLNFFYETHGTGINPLKSISYNLDAWAYLLNHQLINYIPSEKEFNIKKGSFKSLIGDKKIPQFKNRLRYYIEKN